MVLNYGILDYLELYKAGKAICEAAEELGQKIIFIASGDLSHHLKDSGHYTYVPEGPVFDEMIINTLTSERPYEAILYDESFCRKAGECGMRSIAMLLGALDGRDYEGVLLGYEGPFGVGYGIVDFAVKGSAKSRIPNLESTIKSRRDALRKNESEHVRLARSTIEAYVKREKDEFVDYDIPNVQAGCFVSIKKSGALRGCIGTIEATQDSLYDEIVHNAIAACSRDGRFFPVEVHELDLLTISVDVLGKPERCEFEGLSPKKYGVIVESGVRRGLLLPDLDGVDTAFDQVRIAKNKAGIEDDDYVLYRFKVERFE